MAYNISSKDLKPIRLANGLFDRVDMEWYTKFFRFGYLNPSDQLSTTREYLFFTRPDLNIINNDGELEGILSNDNYFNDAFNRYRPVLHQLQKRRENLPFVNLLSATVKSSWDIPGYSADDIDGPATSFGDQVRYRGCTLTTESEGYDFSLEFQDTKYLELYTFFKIYDEYENFKKMGVIKPDEYYIMNKILHDQMALYKIVVAEDYETIIYWAKAWGVYPKNVPREAFSNLDTVTDGLKYSINFHAEWIEDMDPYILYEFKHYTDQYFKSRSNIPLYDQNNKSINGVMCNVPTITYNKNPQYRPFEGCMYKLKWR